MCCSQVESNSCLTLETGGSNLQLCLCGYAMHHFGPFLSCVLSCLGQFSIYWTKSDWGLMGVSRLSPKTTLSLVLNVQMSYSRFKMPPPCITSRTVTAPLSVLGGTSIWLKKLRGHFCRHICHNSARQTCDCSPLCRITEMDFHVCCGSERRSVFLWGRLRLCVCRWCW